MVKRVCMYIPTVVIKNRDPATCVSIERKIVLVRMKAVLMRVTIVDGLTGEYFNGVNHIQSVILESIVVRE